MANEPISDEDKALIRYMELSGVPHRVTCTVNHPTNTNAGYPSYHRLPGSNGLGLAVDFAGRSAGRDSQELAAIFFALEHEAHSLHELIYAGPQVDHNIKDGRRVAKYASADHHDHVHVSVKKGVLLIPPHSTPTTPGDDDMPAFWCLLVPDTDPAPGTTDGLGRRAVLVVNRSGATFALNSAVEYKALSDYGVTRSDINGAEYDQATDQVILTAGDWRMEDGRAVIDTYALARR